MEVIFTENFVFGHEIFISSCIKIQQFGPGGVSNCLIADRYGSIFLPVISDSDILSLKKVELQDIRSMNRSVKAIHCIDYKNRCYLFAACEEEGGEHCLITYSLSDSRLLQTYCNLPSIQTLKLNYRPLDLASSIDGKGTTIIVFGSDKRVHLYLLDSQCILHRPRKSSVMNPLLKQLLLSFENKNSVTAALPLRLLSTDYNKYVHNDILVGYSNGIVNWFRESKAISMTESSKQFLQEIPLFHGHSENFEEGMNSPKSTSSEMQTPIESNLSKNTNTPKNLEQKLTGQDKINESTVIAKTDISQALKKDKTTENQSISINHKIEIKSLLFDGIACFCYYQIQLKSDGYNTNKSSPKYNLNMKLKHSKYQQHAIIGLASGSCFLVSFDEIETPVRVSPDTHNHGGVLALALKGSPNSANQDIFMGIHDGTIILVTYKEKETKSNTSKFSRIFFTVIWTTQLAFPILSLCFGQMISHTENQSKIETMDLTDEQNNNEKFGKNDLNVLPDHLAVVTSKSFHLFSQQIFFDKVEDVDQLIKKFSSMINFD